MIIRATGRTGINGERKVRYAVVGLGYISQVAALPAFKHARRNSELTALVSHDAKKLKDLGKQHGVKHLCTYDDYEDLLRSGEVDAVFIGLPNSMHEEYTVRAAEAGVHVLCEKPMAVLEEECERMIRACRRADVRLMIAYRLHLEPTTLKVLELVRSGKIGKARVFNSVFSMQVKDADNIRLRAELGGGPLYDLGVYCINAARMIFHAEPEEVFAYAASSGDERFREVPEMVSAVLRYPGERLATFTCSFGAAGVSTYQVVGTKGDIRVEPGYEFAEGLAYKLTVDGRSTRVKSDKKDQFAAEMLYFSDCVLEGRDPEPSGQEGLADVRIIQALRWSARRGEPAVVGGMPDEPPTPGQRVNRPGVRKPRLVNAREPSID